MHSVQVKILTLSDSRNLASLKLREIGELVGEFHPQKIKHHLNQLFKKGFLKESLDKKVITRVNINALNDKFISIPILGSANCGEALMFAEENLEGYLQVSRSVVPSYRPQDMFIVRAVGNSMNQSNINGNTIEDGDYLVIDRAVSGSFDNKYVLSIINGMANIKKFIMDQTRERILLVSESTQDYAPIIIHNNDYDNYLVNGIVVGVIKKA